MLGYGALTAVVLGAYNFTGGSLSGYKKDRAVDEFERKQELRKNRRIPIEQTISEIGERRGMYILLNISIGDWLSYPGIKAPGYEERRRQRLKEKYGIDVPVRD